jgi:hypothetical protein
MDEPCPDDLLKKVQEFQARAKRIEIPADELAQYKRIEEGGSVLPAQMPHDHWINAYWAKNGVASSYCSLVRVVPEDTLIVSDSREHSFPKGSLYCLESLKGGYSFCGVRKQTLTLEEGGFKLDCLNGKTIDAKLN